MFKRRWCLPSCVQKTPRPCRPSISRHKLVLLIHRVFTPQNPHLGLILLFWRKTVFAIIIWPGPLTLFVALFIKESFLKLHRGFFFYPPHPLHFLFLLFLFFIKEIQAWKNTFFLLYGSWCSSKNTALKLDPLTGSETTDTEQEEEEE